MKFARWFIALAFVLGAPAAQAAINFSQGDAARLEFHQNKKTGSWKTYVNQGLPIFPQWNFVALENVTVGKRICLFGGSIPRFLHIAVASEYVCFNKGGFSAKPSSKLDYFVSVNGGGKAFEKGDFYPATLDLEATWLVPEDPLFSVVDVTRGEQARLEFLENRKTAGAEYFKTLRFEDVSSLDFQPIVTASLRRRVCAFGVDSQNIGPGFHGRLRTDYLCYTDLTIPCRINRFGEEQCPNQDHSIGIGNLEVIGPLLEFPRVLDIKFVEINPDLEPTLEDIKLEIPAATTAR